VRKISKDAPDFNQVWRGWGINMWDLCSKKAIVIQRTLFKILKKFGAYIA